ncbi:O-antigen ligase family protein [Planctomonas psychrotolerans]|uniref:O-antigen ligase family protein n=1 Tax=Planctomonas psychrotolerans TaxID=2528712 RepID=UPI00123B31E9|nr:O-antigen ligase family protein [Planctomonas psychrotolerans]
MSPHPSKPLPEQVSDFLGSARFSAALTTTILSTVLLAHALRSMIGWPGYLAILATLVPLAALSLVAKRGDYEWRGLLPISLLVFVAWCGLTVLWSRYQWATVSGVLFQVTIAFLAIYIAIARDLIQIVRAVGDVMRALLLVSITLEVLSGLLIDLPIRFLGIQGNLDVGGPIQGVMGGRNAMGTVALIAAITFAIEYFTRSVRKGVAIGSFVAACLVVLFTRAPVIGGVVAVLLLGAAALLWLRRIPRDRRGLWQVGLLSGALLGTVFVVLLRGQLIRSLSAEREFAIRASLWRDLLRLADLNQLEGWGWVGYWRPELIPFAILGDTPTGIATSAMNSFVDAYFQTGLVGMLVFMSFGGLAFLRSWQLASDKRSVSYLWTPLVLIVLAIVSLAQSYTLVEWGWLLLVICAVKAAQDKSWRGILA